MAEKARYRMKKKNKSVIQSLSPTEAPEEVVEIPEQAEFYKMPARFGHVPVEEAPLGWDAKLRFERVYPRVRLPFQVVGRVSFGHPDLEPNRLFFGDNLHIMRMLPKESIDLIYIDPPFFSGRNYNILWGDQNELRSFSDIWEGGMPGYLVWLNARLYEMKRLLKKTGSIYVHLDWHASHYVKVEMDKIFGYDNFVNEIIWAYRTGGATTDRWGRKHDTILYYGRSKKRTFKVIKEKSFQSHRYGYKNVPYYIDEETGQQFRYALPRDVWELTMGTGTSERIGYPTQKPEGLLEKIIEAGSNPGDVVADFFCGGGTTSVVAQRLGRRWVACDNSRIAVAVTADRIARLVENMSGKFTGNGKPQQTSIEVRPIQQTLGTSPQPDFTIEHWGIYEITHLAKMQPLEFRRFVIEAYNGRPDTTHSDIHGYKDREPLYVGSPNPDERITKEEVVKFAEAVVNKKGVHRGTMLAWAFTPEARLISEKIAAQEKVSLEFVRLSLVPIDSPAFKSHVAEKDPRYTSLLSFVLPPAVRIGIEKIKGRTYRFDVSESVSMNPGGKIVNVQWDFDYRGRFSSTQGYSFVRGKDNEPLLKTEYEFSREGKFTVACRVQDDLGGEATLLKNVEVK